MLGNGPSPRANGTLIMKRNKVIITTAAGVLAAAGLVTGAAAIASAASPAATGTYAGVTGEGQRPVHAAVTGAEMTKVAAAVTAKDSAVTVTEVRKEADGTYHVRGTKAGADVGYEVSADLTTVTARTARTGGPGGGRGAHGGSADTAVTGAEMAKVAAAITAKDSAVTVTEVRQDADGSYDVVGTKAGATVAFDVTKDLTTVTAHAAHPAGAPGTAG